MVDRECVKVDSKKYKTRTEWAKNSATAYQSARKNGWLDEVCSHMIKKK